MIRLGLTGSIATGKSTTARLFAQEGIPIHDADAAVHALYQGEAVAPVGALIPEAIIDGKVDRARLRAALRADPALLPKLEAIVHPLVRAHEQAAAQAAQADGHHLMVFDVPLLFETGGQARMHKVVVVHCAPELQLARLMAREGMREDDARLLMDRQMPQADKMERADFLVSTDAGIEAARADVRRIIAALHR